jgi:hypothetical protein
MEDFLKFRNDGKGEQNKSKTIFANYPPQYTNLFGR